MKASKGTRSWALRILRVIIAVELVYLVVLNIALYLPLTQTLINQIKPDKFHVTWARAWTWYPFRLHATGVSANGQTRSQQWQLDSPSLSGSIAILPLIAKRVWLSNVVGTDISYRQRPRLKPDKNYDNLIAFFPEIKGRTIVLAETAPLKKKRPWRLAIDGISASGQHQLWIMQFRGGARGELMADISYETRGGPFSLSNGVLDVNLDTLYINGNNEVFKQGTVQGKLEFRPFVPRENKNINILKHILLDASIDIDANSLAFINLFTRNFNDMTIDGSGHLAGHVALDGGDFLAGTNLEVEAGNIMITVMGHLVEGEGALRFASSTRTDAAVELLVNYHDLELSHKGDQSPLLVGEQLQLEMVGASSVFATQEDKNTRRKLVLSIAGLAAPDLALFQHYLPDKWPFEIHGGAGSLRAVTSFTTHSMDIDVSVQSQAAELGLHQYRFDSDLDVALKLSNPSMSEMDTAISGSYIKLSNANLGQSGRDSAKPWEASFVVKKGKLGVLGQQQKRESEQLTDLFQVLAKSEGTQILGKLHGFLEFESNVSSLRWIGALLDESYQLDIAGLGEVNGTVRLEAGLPAPGTDIKIQSPDLGVGILDYVSTGAGRIGLRVDKGDAGPDWQLNLALDKADLLREGEEIPYIQDVTLEIAALLEDFEKDARRKASAVTFRILGANVTDMSIYNSYLPPDSPLQIVDGEASLTAEIQLEPEDADGWLKLQAEGLTMVVDEQSVSADLAADIVLAGGIPGEMIFDLSGSELALDNVKVIGEKETFDEADWLAKVKLTQAQTTWKKPLKLDAMARLTVSDTSPVVAAFGNRGYRPGWLLNMLSIHDIQGTAKFVVADNKVLIPYANAVSDTVEVGAKGSITEQSREGVIYARYRKLDAVLKIFEGDRNVDLIRAREKYDTYRVAQ